MTNNHSVGDGEALANATKELERLRLTLRGVWMRHRPPQNIKGASGKSIQQLVIDDDELVFRIISAFRKADMTPLGPLDSMWLGSIATIRNAEHRTMQQGSEHDVQTMLRNPRQTKLFYGFEFDDLFTIHSHIPPWDEWNYDCLCRLAEAVGTVRLEYPEAPAGAAARIQEVEDILIGLDRAFGFKIQFPNVFPNEFGLLTTRGVASFRAVQSLFQAWRIFELVERRSSARVLEIGAGLGWTTYFVRQFGIENYSIIDLPLTNAAQAYFLGRVIGSDAIQLFGEEKIRPMKIFPPVSFFDVKDHYDLILNVDSLTEMARTTAEAYMREISVRTPLFLSINHEFNGFTARQVIDTIPKLRVVRAPYWLRRGYVEELVYTSANGL